MEFWDLCQGDGWESVETISSWAVLSGLKLSRCPGESYVKEFLALEPPLRFSAAQEAQCIETGLLDGNTDGSTEQYRAAQVRTTGPGCRIGSVIKSTCLALAEDLGLSLSSYIV